MEKSCSLKDLAHLTGAQVVGDEKYQISGVNSLEDASSSDVSFLANPKYRQTMDRSLAGAVFIKEGTDCLPGKNYLICPNPSEGFLKATAFFLHTPNATSGFTHIHESAVIHPSATIEEGVSIGPFVSIDQGSIIKKGSTIFSHVSIGPGVFIGENCVIHPHVTIREGCLIGNRVILQPGAVIGSCGFGFTTDQNGVHTKIDQLGVVEIEDDVEIGANTTIDRARFKKTVIGKGTKIDNLVQIGHNTSLGKHNIIVSLTGISGSVKTGNHVVMGGQCGVAGHLEITSGVTIASRGGVRKSLHTPGVYGGSPLMPLKDHQKQEVYKRNLGKYIKMIEEIKKQIEHLKLLENLS